MDHNTKPVSGEQRFVARKDIAMGLYGRQAQDDDVAS